MCVALEAASGVVLHAPGLGYRQAKTHHGAIGGVLFHRLQRPGVVQDVETVHEYGLLDPLAADVVPVGQAVQYHVEAAALLQIEGLDGQALDDDSNLIVLHPNGEVEVVDDALETERPADVGTQRKTNSASHVGQGSLLWVIGYRGRRCRPGEEK